MNTAVPPAAKPPAASSHPAGRLDWRRLVRWLRDDGLISEADHDVLDKRFSAAASKQHPLVRLGSAGLSHARTGKALDVETLTEWLAGRAGLPYQRIDPLKVDVGRVSDAMSINYAE